MTADQPYLVHGLTVSFFTRKVTGYLDHLRVPWRLEPSVGANPAARELGWNGGIPVVSLPDGHMVWDSTSIIVHLDGLHPARSVLPDDPDLRFLAFVLDDFNDEWFYRHAVGTRWCYDENVTTGSWDIARETTREVPASADAARAFVTESMVGCLPRLGVSRDNVDAWVEASLVPWLRALSASVADGRFVLGTRPSLADFAFFGGNVAHFVNDPWCRRLLDEVAPDVVAATHAMERPGPDELGEWFDPDELPESVYGLLGEAGRHYLPWVAEATVVGRAAVDLDGTTTSIPTTNFLTEARGIMLARYREARSERLDAILDRAGILHWYADFVGQATAVPDATVPPRPRDNRPYPAGPGTDERGAGGGSSPATASAVRSRKRS